MGKFIDKKKSQTFNVVRRSQRDPLIADESSSPLVLVPVDGPRSRTDGERLKQVVDGQEAYFDQVPGRAAGGRSANAPVRVRPEAAAGDNEDEDEDEDEDDDDDYEDISDGEEDGEENNNEEDNEARARPPPRRSARSTGRPGASAADHAGEAAKFGIFYDDTTYDYTQHLKIIGDHPSSVFVPAKEALTGRKARPNDLFGLLDDTRSTAGSEAPGDVTTEAARLRFNLPADVFASPFEEDVGLLNLAAPVTGPQPELGEDVAEVLEALEDEAFLGELDEDFVLQLADADGDDDDEDYDYEYEEDEEDEDEDEDDDTPKTRPTGAARPPPSSGGRARQPSVSSDGGSTEGGAQRGRRAGGSAFSMTSSVLPRTAILQVLDDRFDRVMDQYDELEIGELDADDPDVAGPQQLDHYGPIFDKFLEQQAENQGKFKDVLDRPVESEASSERSGARTGQGKGKQVAFQVPTGRTTVLIRGNEPRQVAWDCESVLSTYSNVYNHPAILDAGPARAPRIRIGQSGMPIGVLGKADKAVDENDDAGKGEGDDDDDDDDDDDATFTSVNAGQARQRQETPEEKRARKKAIKEQRKARREEKKSTKAAFKSEQIRQEREQQQSRQQAVTAGVRL